MSVVVLAPKRKWFHNGGICEDFLSCFFFGQNALLIPKFTHWMFLTVYAKLKKKEREIKHGSAMCLHLQERAAINPLNENLGLQQCLNTLLST